MNISRIDVFWNYLSTFLKISSSFLLLPLILKKLPSEEVGIWAIFSAITSFTFLLDLGFSSTFSRSITYVFSGANELKVTGFSNQNGSEVNYNLLKGLIQSMKWFYSRVALIIFVFLATIGSLYVNRLLDDFSGNKQNVIIAWILYCVFSSYSLYTLYYDSLLQGRGYIKISKQIYIISQIFYLIFASIGVIYGLGLLAIVLSNFISIIIIRVASNKIFYTNDLKNQIDIADGEGRKKILKILFPNAIKVGITSLGSFLVSRSAIFIGSMFISLSALASFGISIQIIGILSSTASVYIYTYFPKISQYRIEGKLKEIKLIYIKSVVLLIVIYIVCSSLLICFGNIMLSFLGSNTLFVKFNILSFIILFSFLEINHSIAGSVLLTKNEVPFYKAAIISGILTLILTYIFLKFTSLGVLGMVLAPGIIQLLYQNWKWPYEVKKDLDISFKDLIWIFKNIRK